MPRSIRRSPFASVIPRPKKTASGRTEAPETPLAIRATGVDVDPEERRRIRARFGRKLGKFATHVERASLRLFDVNGPRGGVDTACRVKLVLSGQPSVVTETVARAPGEAADRAIDRSEQALRRVVRKSGATAPRPQRPEGRAEAAPPKPPRRRSTAGRNVKERVSGMTSSLEGSAKDRPSRKSTRKSVNRAKRDDAKRQRAVRKARGPKRRATAAQAKGATPS